jgi:hypothetical protein
LDECCGAAGSRLRKMGSPFKVVLFSFSTH